MKTLLKSLITCYGLVLITVHFSAAQVVMKDPRVNPFGNINQLATSASSVQMLNEMLQQLPADLPHCAQNFDTFGVIATGHLSSTNPISGWYSTNSLAFKRNRQLTFDLNRTSLGATASNTGWEAYRVFVESGQVCVSRGNSILARNIQVVKLSATAYSLTWYTTTGIVTVTFVKKKDSIIC